MVFGCSYFFACFLIGCVACQMEDDIVTPLDSFC